MSELKKDVKELQNAVRELERQVAQISAAVKVISADMGLTITNSTEAPKKTRRKRSRSRSRSRSYSRSRSRTPERNTTRNHHHQHSSRVEDPRGVHIRNNDQTAVDVKAILGIAEHYGETDNVVIARDYTWMNIIFKEPASADRMLKDSDELRANENLIARRRFDRR